MSVVSEDEGTALTERPRLFRPRPVAAGRSGTLVDVTAAEAQWDYISFAVRRVAAGESWQLVADEREVCLVLLAGCCRVQWEGGPAHVLGPRPDVFAAYPHAIYLPKRISCTVTARETTEIADCRAPSTSTTGPTLVRPEDCGFEIRGGGSATRQVIDILPPQFPADKLLICEVFTPGGNWSSYPPHKHDQDEPPVEVDLDETYYFRMRDPHGYAFQRLYASSGAYDETFKVEHGDLLLIHDGYHPFVTAHGYDAYYLNVLAGPRRSMAARDDPQHARFRREWPAPDPRVPLVSRPEVPRRE